MELNSLTFIMLFLPMFIGSMLLFKNAKHQKIIILLFSMIFYFYNDIYYFGLLIAVILTTYCFALLMNGTNKKTFYFIYLILIVGLLAFFKYGNYFIDSLEQYLLFNDSLKILMPLGISFYIFTSISYVSDCYYGKIEPDHNLINIASYLVFFPTIVSGPILRYNNFNNFLDEITVNSNTIAKGFRRFIIGLFKKTIISNQLSVVVTAIFDPKTELSFVLAWFGAIAFMLQLYYDFSSYSDMAIAIAEMIGLKIPENFNDPYMSLSIQEFWRRWHISLGSWFRDYVYIPLGGSRVSTLRWLFNTFIVWALTGIWHGSTFGYLLWGLYNGILLVFNKFVLSKMKMPKIISWAMTQFMVLFGFLIFRIQSFTQLKTFISCMLLRREFLDLFYLKSLDIHYTWLYVIIAIIFIFPFFKKAFYTIEKKNGYIFDLIMILMLFVSLVYIISGSYSSFIYAGF